MAPERQSDSAPDYQPRKLVPAYTTIHLEPTVAWPEEMTPGKKHLVEVSLDLVNEAGERVWPEDMVQEEKYTYLALLSSPYTGGRFDMYVRQGPEVEIYKSGAPTKPAEWVTTPPINIKSGIYNLGLEILNQYGVSVGEDDLPVTVKSLISRRYKKFEPTYLYTINPNDGNPSSAN